MTSTDLYAAVQMTGTLSNVKECAIPSSETQSQASLKSSQGGQTRIFFGDQTVQEFNELEKGMVIEIEGYLDNTVGDNAVFAQEYAVIGNDDDDNEVNELLARVSEGLVGA